MNTVVNPPPNPDPTEREKFDFEKETTRAEDSRDDREIKVKEGELELKKRQAKSPWTNPLMVAVVGALIIGIGNYKVSRDNAKDQQTDRELQASSDALKT
jgi:hypothetical protein